MLGDDKEENSSMVMGLDGQENEDEICLRDRIEKESESGSQLTLRLHEVG